MLTIFVTFDAAINQLINTVEQKPDGRKKWLSCPPSDIYTMKKAAIAIDGQVGDFADYALLINDCGSLTSILGRRELADIQAHPENYVSFEVYPK